MSVARTKLVTLKRSLRLRTRLKEFRRWSVRYWGGGLIVHDWWLDRRFGGYCGGTIASPFASQGATRTESCSYRTLGVLFGHPMLRIDPRDVLVDVGCGKGRVINFWLLRGRQNSIVGVELTPSVAEWTRRRLSSFTNVRIVEGDASSRVPPDGTLFFLFNPFGRDTMQAFALRVSQNAGPAGVRIVYLNARHIDVFPVERWTITDIPTGSPDRAVLITAGPASS